MSLVDNLVRFVILALFVWNDVVQYPIPVPFVDKEMVSSAFIDFNQGICPFLIIPIFGQNDAHFDKYRQISFNCELKICFNFLILI